MTSSSREVTEVRPDSGVVVGDDGSSCAATAVRAAAEEAQRRGVPLHVVRAWSITTAARPADVPPGIVPSLLEFEAATRSTEESRVQTLVNERVPVEVHAVHSNPAKALIAASEHADVLVVGTRGLGGFKSLVLGSVAEQCIRHAASSVLVVRG